MLEAKAGDLPDLAIGWRLLPPVSHKLDTEQHAAPADIADQLELSRHLGQCALYAGLNARGFARHVLLDHDVKALLTGSAQQWIGGVRAGGEVSVLDSALGNLGRGADGADRQATAEVLGYGDYVRSRILVVEAEHLSCLSVSRLSLT